jgi:hypothetical protein
MRGVDPPIRPPQMLEQIVALFASSEEADAVLGDLGEEFVDDIERYGDKEARCRYRREAWSTIRDLAVSQWRTRPWSSVAIVVLGFALTTGIRTSGFRLDSIGFVTYLGARYVVTHYAVYYYISAPLFWDAVDLVAPFMAGILIALIARSIGLRPMSAALALALATAVWLAVDRPIMMWLYGPPLAVRVTVASTVLRWLRGVLKFGAVMMIGAAFGRKLPLPGRPVRLRSSAQ